MGLGSARYCKDQYKQNGQAGELLIYLFESIVSHIVDNNTNGICEGVQISPGKNIYEK